jgi:glycosyltransferase involved in cell wall biosynthesis
MRILHVGFGFPPWIVNGLVIYGDSVMDGQVRQGHTVGYFFPARQLPFFHRSFVRRWERRGVQMFEWVNSSLIVGRHRGTADPESDLDHAPGEAAFCRVLQRFRPELIHVHDLGGLPSSILDIGRRHDLPTAMTIHDYHVLCPTVKLYDAHDQICLRRDPGAMCAVCCADAPVDNREEVGRTLAYARTQIRAALPSLDAALRRAQSRPLGAAGTRLVERAVGLRGAGPASASPGPGALTRAPRASAGAYQRRRDMNIERLSRIDALIAGSERSAAIYRELGVAGERIRIVPINPPHIELLRPKRHRPVGDPLRFVALNACSSTEKGADLIVEALALLSERGLDHRFRLSVHGWVAPHVYPMLAAHASVDLRGEYLPEALDELLEEGDVGLFPSVWEEVYGFVGLEFLAKGIPVIGNAVGAISEYVRPGKTGWLNYSGSASELADLMIRAIEDHAEVERLGRALAQSRDELIRPFSAGLADLSELYEELVHQVAAR